MNRFISSKYFIFIALGLGLVLRLISLNQSLWLDEATTALVAKMGINDFFSKFLPADFHPPIYYLLIKIWSSFFGTSEVALRLPSVFFGLGTIYFTYIFVKKLSGLKSANIASILVATSGLFIYYSEEARMYIMAAFLVSVVFYFYLEEKWLLFSLFLALLGMTDYVALLVVPVFLILNEKKRSKVLISLLPLAFTFTLWLPYFLRQVTGGLDVRGSPWWDVLGGINFKNLALIPVKFILGRISFDNDIFYGIVAVLVTSLYFGLAALNILGRPLKGNPCKVLYLWLGVPILLGILVSIRIPILYYFRFIFCLPAFYILISLGIEKVKRWKLFFVLILTINLLSSIYYLATPRFQREDWRLAAKTMGSNTIVVPFYSQTEALEYYGKKNQVVHIDQLESEDKSTVWLSRYVWEVFDPDDLARKKIEALGYNRVEEANFKGVVFWKYLR